jgi:hypothetical protein
MAVCHIGQDAPNRSWRTAPAVYHQAMSHRTLLESPPSPSGGTEDDVEPYFPEPLVELDVDSLD